MKSHHFALLLLAAVTAVQARCRKEDTPDCHYTIMVRNTSDRPIHVNAITDGPLVHPGQMPDPFRSPERQMIAAHGTSGTPLSLRDCWEGTLGSEGVVHIYCFNDSLNATPWDSIVLHRWSTELNLDLDDLRSRKFEVALP